MEFLDKGGCLRMYKNPGEGIRDGAGASRLFGMGFGKRELVFQLVCDSPRRGNIKSLRDANGPEGR